MGDADGTVTVAGKQYPFHINSMRDHSYGNTDPVLFRVKTDRKPRNLCQWVSRSQTRVEIAASIRIPHNDARKRNANQRRHCQPTMHFLSVILQSRRNLFSNSKLNFDCRLELGYVYSPDGQLFPVEKVDLNLWNIGEKGTPPTDYYFTFEAGSWQETIFFPPSEDDPFYPIDSQRDVGRSGERDRVTGIPHRLGMGGAYCGTHVHLRSERSARLGRFRVHVQSQEWPSD